MLIIIVMFMFPCTVIGTFGLKNVEQEKIDKMITFCVVLASFVRKLNKHRPKIIPR